MYKISTPSIWNSLQSGYLGTLSSISKTLNDIFLLDRYFLTSGIKCCFNHCSKTIRVAQIDLFFIKNTGRFDSSNNFKGLSSADLEMIVGLII
ncbi:hypothetical protein QE152_g10532 [Popillia japonica]|uniref:Uncharacterized protein n=1 Tax=Popillia japonica TaxID=7064 RepID=A0AAW1LUA5_POPJA